MERYYARLRDRELFDFFVYDVDKEMQYRHMSVRAHGNYESVCSNAYIVNQAIELLDKYANVGDEDNLIEFTKDNVNQISYCYNKRKVFNNEDYQQIAEIGQIFCDDTLKGFQHSCIASVLSILFGEEISYFTAYGDNEKDYIECYAPIDEYKNLPYIASLFFHTGNEFEVTKEIDGERISTEVVYTQENDREKIIEDLTRILGCDRCDLIIETNGGDTNEEA